jgi:DNA mismatch repair ATPase MutS
MKAYLMHPDRDFSQRTLVPLCERDVVDDLELETLFSAMARADPAIADVVREALLASLTDVDTIQYRQAILSDCIENGETIRAIYDLAVETLAAERRAFLLGRLGRTPGSVLFRAVDLLEMLEGRLRQLRSIAHEGAPAFTSTGLKRLLAMLRTDLNEQYFETIRSHLRQLRFPDGVLLSARLGSGNKGTDYVLRTGPAPERGWIQRAFSTRTRGAYSFKIADQDEGGARALAALRDRGIALVANALAQSTDHILAFFSMLRTELAFYVGCLNLRAALASLGEPTCIPVPIPADKGKRSAKRLYDPCLALEIKNRVVDNDLLADSKTLVIVTGANRGGKSTFLRSVGIAQLMMQCGMFVPAENFSASLCERIFTHYKREEDPTMKSGKFDEELGRMSAIVDNLVPSSLVLLNESFAATNESEGAEIARQVVSALTERRVIVYYVTHQYEFASGFPPESQANILFLLAERLDDGSRTFKIMPGTPLQTSYGRDLYDRIFGDADAGMPKT